MAITNDPTSPVGRSIPLLPADIKRLRSGGNDAYVADKAYNLDPQFRSLADHYLKPDVQSQLDPYSKQNLPKMLLNMHYFGKPELDEADDLTATLSQDATQPRSLMQRFSQSFGTADERAAAKQQEIAEGRSGFSLRDLPGDIADVAGGALPLAGSIVGAVVGAGAGIPTGPGAIASGVVGAGAGAAAGEAGRQAMGRLMGKRQGETFSQELDSISGQATAAGAGELVGGQLIARPLAAAGRKALAPFTQLFDQEIADLAARKGVRLPVSAMTETNPVRIAETVASKGITGSGVEQIVHEGNEKIVSLADDVVRSIGGSDDLMTAGKSVIDGADKFRKVWTQTKSKLYNKADALISARPKKEYIDIEATKTVLDNILSSKNQAGEVLGDSVVKTRLSTIRSNLDKKLSVKAISSALDELGQLTNRGTQLVSTGDEAALRKVAATLSGDLDTHISKIAPDIGKALDKADAFYKNGIELLESRVGGNIGHLMDSPERIVDSILRPNAQSDVKRLITLIGKGKDGAARIANVRTAFARKLVDGSVNPKTGIMSGAKITSTLKRYGSTMKELFEPETLQAFEEVGKLAGAMDRSQVVAQGSNTAFSSKIIGLITAIASGNIPTAISIAAGDVALSRIFTTDIGRKWLTTGFKASQGFSNAAGTAVRAGSQGARQLLPDQK